MFKKSFVRQVLGTGVLALGVSSAMAAQYPAEPVTLVVPYSAGGLADMLGRSVASQLSAQWGKPVVVENRAGANTIIGAQQVAAARPDGLTILLANTATLTSNQFLYKKLPYDPEKDFVPAVNLAQTSNVLLASPKLPVKSIPELVRYARDNPGKVSYGTFGVGSSSHLDTAALANKAGLELTHVPYKGAAEIYPALMGGHVDIALVGLASAIPFVQDGRLNALAVFAPQREGQLPQVPTLAESGYDGIGAQSWFGLVLPRGTSPAVVEKIAQDAQRLLKDESFVAQHLTRVGLRPLGEGPQEYAATIARDKAYFQEHIPALNIELN